MITMVVCFGRKTLKTIVGYYVPRQGDQITLEFEDEDGDIVEELFKVSNVRWQIKGLNVQVQGMNISAEIEKVFLFVSRI